MEYRELSPGPFLTPYVAALWTLRGFASEFKAFTGWAPRAFARQKLGELTRQFVTTRADSTDEVSVSSKTPQRAPAKLSRLEDPS
jgi:hypothetical protein